MFNYAKTPTTYAFGSPFSFGSGGWVGASLFANSIGMQATQGTAKTMTLNLGQKGITYLSLPGRPVSAPNTITYKVINNDTGAELLSANAGSSAIVVNALDYPTINLTVAVTIANNVTTGASLLIQWGNCQEGRQLRATHGDLINYSDDEIGQLVDTTERVPDPNFLVTIAPSGTANKWVDTAPGGQYAWTNNTGGGTTCTIASRYLTTSLPVRNGLYTVELDLTLTGAATLQVVLDNSGYHTTNLISSGIHTFTIPTYNRAGGLPFLMRMLNSGTATVKYCSVKLQKSLEASAWVDFYTKAANKWYRGYSVAPNAPLLTAGALIETKSSLPEIKNGLLVDASHVINYPIPGVTTNYFKSYAVNAWALKTGQSLTAGERLELNNNLLFANPRPGIKRKLQAYYLFNQIDTTSGNRILDLLGANHATLTSTDASAFTLKPLTELR